MRWVYNISLASGKHTTCISTERIYDCLRYFRNRFGEDGVLEVTERWGGGKPVSSSLLPTCEDEATAIAEEPGARAPTIRAH